MKRRNQIEMLPEEQETFLENARTLYLCTIDPRGFPHAVAMWFCRIDGVVHMTTFRKSQKVANLRRNPKATLLAESGATYADLKGLMLRCEAEVVEDTELCVDVLMRVHARHGGDPNPSLREVLRPQAAKRGVLRFRPVHVSSWDHTKLGGTY